jgi:tetratricopeptide (TPR) repeat protein
METRATAVPWQISKSPQPAARWGAIGLLAMVVCCSGCRAIRQHVESRQSIAARKLSREGLEAMHAEKWQEAEDAFAGALALNQADDRAHAGLAEVLWERNERKQAIMHMEQAVRLSGSEPQMAIRMGRMYYDVGQIEDAQQQSDDALTGTGRDLASAWALRGDVVAARGDDDAALACYHRALVLQPEYPEVQIAIADVYLRHGRYDRLLATLDRLRDNVEADSCPLRVHLLRGTAMMQLGRPREAAELFRTVCQQIPDDPNLLMRLAEAEYETGDFAASRQALGRVFELDPNNTDGRTLVARMETAARSASR